MRDHSRALTQYGKLQAQMMGQWLKLNLHELDLAIVSSARRTQQTFDALELGIEQIVEDKAYNAGSELLEELIRQHGAGHEDVMIVGHNPGVSDLASRAGYPQDLAPCSCVVLEFAEQMAEFSPDL
jgi:phosphohistidine phosphatase